MRELDVRAIGEAVGRLIRDTATKLPDFVRQDILRAIDSEPSPKGRELLRALIRNADLALQNRLPLCQDSGLPQALLELGTGIRLTGGSLKEAMIEYARTAWAESFLRQSGADPLTRENLGRDIPLNLEFSPTEGSIARVFTLAKGGGCDNKGALFNLPPSTSPKAVKAAIVEKLLLAGPDSCPPWYVGVCVGGSFESAPRHARRALWDLAFGLGQSERERELSDELLSLVNATGMGPMALGGRCSALGLRARIVPTHIASLPVAINLCCHSFRPGMALI
ncbi:MAG: fumarate hydratase [Deltaproteobacteria bacterium]|nr:fumarate hydratase [Deltaproteobacteria bacterium]